MNNKTLAAIAANPNAVAKALTEAYPLPKPAPVYKGIDPVIMRKALASAEADLARDSAKLASYQAASHSKGAQREIAFYTAWVKLHTGLIEAIKLTLHAYEMDLA